MRIDEEQVTTGLRGDRRGGWDVELLEGAEALRALDEEWDALVDRQQLPSATLASDWLRLLHGGESALVVQVRKGGALIAGGAFRRLWFGPFAATWFGGARQPGILAAPGFEAAAAEVVRALLARSYALWLPRISAVGPTRPAIHTVAPWGRETSISPGGYMIELPPPRLERARSKNGYALRRAARHGAQITVAVRREEHELLGAFQRLSALYRRRWRGREDERDRHSDIIPAAPRYHALLPLLARRDRARIVEVFEGDQLVASTLGFVTGRGALFHTTATEPDGRLRGPGHVAMLAWVEEAMAAGAEVMYLGRGAGEPEGPKMRLGAHEVPLFDVLLARSAVQQRVMEFGTAARAPIRRARARA
jgi:hypothetical protein